MSSSDSLKQFIWIRLTFCPQFWKNLLLFMLIWSNLPRIEWFHYSTFYLLILWTIKNDQLPSFDESVSRNRPGMLDGLRLTWHDKSCENRSKQNNKRADRVLKNVFGLKHWQNDSAKVKWKVGERGRGRGFHLHMQFVQLLRFFSMEWIGISIAKIDWSLIPKLTMLTLSVHYEPLNSN